MKCPNCNANLEIKEYKGIEVNQCPKCEGIWFDFKELDDLEDTVLSDDELKGTLVWDKKPSERKCPKCGKNMIGFNYRLNGLFLDYCEDMHGYWLDKGEETRVLEEMKDSRKDIEKKYQAEDDWAKHLKRLQSPSFFSQLTALFR